VIDEDLRLDGEDPKTLFVEDAVHWVAVYSELLTFTENLLFATGQSLAAMEQADAHTDAMTDLVLLRAQAARYRRRLQEWTDRVTGFEKASRAK
jgi:hypothetical protein